MWYFSQTFGTTTPVTPLTGDTAGSFAGEYVSLFSICSEFRSASNQLTFQLSFHNFFPRNFMGIAHNLSRLLQEVLNPLRGFVKDDTILVRARLVYPGPDAHPDPPPSLSQSHSTQAPSSQLHTPQSHASSSLCRTSSSLSSCAGSSRVTQIPTSLFPPLSQLSSQDSMTETSSQLTPSSTSILPPEMASFLSCPHCNEQYEAEGQRSPNTLLCGHSFCLGTLLYEGRVCHGFA